jgi:Flp pilus assembly protein TadB/Mg-chelatase subunit ChlD
MIGLDASQRLGVASALALLTVYAGEHHAYADTGASGRVTVLSQDNGTARLLFSARGLPSGGRVDPTSVRVVLDGQPATTTAILAGSTASTAVTRRAVLVFDTSGSMAGAGIAGARRAAIAFLSKVPADVLVGLVTFADRPQVVVPPTLSRPALKSAVSRLQAGGETALYDGVRLGARVLGSTGERALVVLSDGADTRSHESLSTVSSELKRRGVRMDAVALRTADAVTASLERLATTTGGKVTAAASAAGLSSAFSAAARTFASELVLGVEIPAVDRGRTLRADVTVGSSSGPISATTDLTVPGAPLAIGRSDTPIRSPRPGTVPAGLLVLLFAGLLAPLLAVLFILEGRRSPQARTQRLLTRYTLKRAGATTGGNASTSSGLSRAGARLTAVADRVASKPARRQKLLVRLSRADAAMTPGEWIAVQALITFCAGALATLAFGSPLAGLLFAVVGFAASTGWLSIKGRRRLRAFEEHLPSALQLVASSLRSGFSLAQALDGVVREGMEPIAGELNRALGQARLGMPLEDALDGISDRMASTDFSWVVMAIRIQREVGGNLAEILFTTTGVMRDRARLRRQVKTLSAEGRLSAYILLALPILMAVYMFALRRSYIRTLYTTGLGIGLLVLAITLVVIGALCMRKIVTVEV